MALLSAECGPALFTLPQGLWALLSASLAGSPSPRSPWGRRLMTARDPESRREARAALPGTGTAPRQPRARLTARRATGGPARRRPHAGRGEGGLGAALWTGGWASAHPSRSGKSNQLSFQEVLWAQGRGCWLRRPPRQGRVPCGSRLAEGRVPLSIFRRGLARGTGRAASIQCPHLSCVQDPEDRMGRPRRPVPAPRTRGAERPVGLYRWSLIAGRPSWSSSRHGLAHCDLGWHVSRATVRNRADCRAPGPPRPHGTSSGLQNGGGCNYVNRHCPGLKETSIPALCV